MLRSDLLRLTTLQGWHVFVPCHSPGSDAPLWWCVRCHGGVTHPRDWATLGDPCRDFLPAIPRQTSPPHDPPPPPPRPGQQSLW